MSLSSPPQRVACLTLLSLLLLLLSTQCTPTVQALAVAANTDADEPHGEAAGAVKSEAPITVFMCADSGEYSGAHELGILQKSMEESEPLSLRHCQSAHLGYILHADGHRVRSMTVTTGIGYISATLCTRSVLNYRLERHYVYSTIVYIGTSGFSPMVGGWDPTNTSAYAAFRAKEQRAMQRGEEEKEELGHAAAAPPPLFKTVKEVLNEQAAEEQARQDEAKAGASFAVRHALQWNFEDVDTQRQLVQDGCAPRLADAARPLAVGSVCVTSAAFLMESGSCVERPRHTQCSRPHCSDFQHSLSSEAKIYFANGDFARAIEAATEGKAWPPMPELVQAGLERFWAANEAIEPAGRVAPSQPAFVTCAEATVNAINVGAERDYLCREYTAYTLNAMRRRRDSTAGEQTPLLTANDVVCVQAMEALGFLRSFAADAAAAASIPVAVLRGASNYDMYPLRKARVDPAVWRAAVAARAVVVSPDVEEALKRSDSEGKAAPIAAYTWEQHFDFMPADEYEAFVLASFHYSVKTVTFVVSNYFFGGRTFD